MAWKPDEPDTVTLDRRTWFYVLDALNQHLVALDNQLRHDLQDWVREEFETDKELSTKAYEAIRDVVTRDVEE